jgi:hypothetical protein
MISSSARMETQIPFESALAVLVPEADNLVEPFRLKYDPSAAAGIPAHITVLYPFKPPCELTHETIQTLQKLFSQISRLDVSFAEWRVLRRVLYLAPQPDEPFKQMTEAVWERFPETPPYDGQFADIIPHLTVAQDEVPERLHQIAHDFDLAAKGRLPIDATVKEIVLLDNQTGRWRVRHRFRLGQV